MAQLCDASSKYKDLISKSCLIHSGSPALYKLKPEKQQFGTLTRLTVGEQNLNKANKTILLVGETGTGKSTLINALFNYIMGVKFEDDIWFQIVEEEKRSQTESQTSDVIVYDIYDLKDQALSHSLTIIDTPGYGDTRGIENDEIVSQKLLDLFRSDDGVHEINAVGLVLKASENRVNDRLKYIFNSVMSLFGKNLEENIIALITHSDGVPPENVFQALDAAEIKCARNEKNQPKHFLFNNKQTTERTKENQRPLKYAWEITDEEIGNFTNVLKTSKPQKLNTTVDVLNSRVRLAACIHNLQDRIELIDLKQTEIRQIQEALKKNEEKMKDEVFTVEVDEVYKDKENISVSWWSLNHKAVTCKVCEENCHYPGCTMVMSPAWCEVMSDGHCTSCTNKCPVSDHVKDKWRYVNKTRKVKKTLTELKEKYEKNKVDALDSLENLEKEMIYLTANKDQCLEEAYQHVVSLEKIALNVNSVSTHVYLDVLIEKMKEKGDTEKVQKLEEMKKQGDEKISPGVKLMVKGLFTSVTRFFPKAVKDSVM